MKIPADSRSLIPDARLLLDAHVVLGAAVLFLIVAIGGIDYDWGIVRLRLHAPSRPILVLLLASTARALIAWRSHGMTNLAGRLSTYAATRGLAALLAATVAVYAHYHVQVCGGLDSYGYVSASSLLASGTLKQAQPLAPLLPFKDAAKAAAPLGYVVGPDGQSQVPRFPLGLPAVMALLRIFGPKGPFFVPLLMGLATLVFAGLLGGEAGMPASSLFAAAIVAADPIFVDYLLQPMSDVPAVCWLTAAVWLRLERPRRWIAAGICGGMAILTRPALIVAVLGLLVVSVSFQPSARSRLRDTAWFGLTLAAFVIVQLIINASLYGSIRSSGYGSAADLFELSYAKFAANLFNFGRWLTYSHTPLVWLIWPVGLGVLWRRLWAWQVSAVALAAALPYFFYGVYNDWESTRFLLPGLVLVLILAARALSAVLAKLSSAPNAPSHLSALVFVVVGFICLAASHRFLTREGVYDYGRLEAKYELVGDWFQRHTSERTVVLSALHSGSIRLYGPRQTIRWDEIPPGMLAPTLRSLEGHGYEPYLALDLPSEPPLFADRFRSELGGLEIKPVARVRVVNIYRLEVQ